MESSLYLQFSANVRKYPRYEAMRFESTVWTYQRLDTEILKTAKRLTTLGVKAKDVVIVSLPNCPTALTLFYAINLLGAVSYNVHPLTKPETMKSYVAKSHSRLVITLGIYAKGMQDVLRDTVRTVAVNPYRHISPIKAAAFRFMAKDLPKDILSFEELPLTDFVMPDPDPEADAVYLNTGGTNGDSKIVRLSSRAINYLARQGYHLIGGDVRRIHMLTAIPLFHGFGLAMGVHTPLSHGASTVLMLSFHRKPAIRLIRSGKATVIIGVPALYNALLSRKRFYGRHLRKQIIAWIGGDNVQQSLLDRWNDAMKAAGSQARLYEGYGLTETSTAINVNYHKENKTGSVGRPIPGVRELIVDKDSGKVLPAGQAGEILIESPTNMTGYLNDEELTRASFVDIEGHHYLRTHDYGYLDSDGYLFFRQRLRRLVKVNGESLCPVDVEKVAVRLPLVDEAYCYGIPDDRKGHVLCLAVSLKTHDPDEEAKTVSDLMALIQKELAPMYVPVRIDIKNPMPHTAIGKIDNKAFPED